MPTTEENPGLPTIVKNVCPLDCPDTCSMLVTVKDGVAVELRGDPDHAFTRGFLCQKMARYLERVYSPDRLLQPLRRVGRKGEGRFEPTTWEDALAEIAQRFGAIASSADGPQAILPYSYCGTMGKLQSSSLDRRFFHRLGASNLDRSICASAGVAGYEYTMGRGRLGADPMAVPKCKFIVNWGSNTVNTNSHLWSLMIEARKAGSAIVTIDPYRSPTAARSDWHIQPRPGTDAALALGVLHVVWRDGLQDDDYLERATIGALELRDRVANEYAPEKVAAITGVDVETIEKLAHRLAREQPSLIRLNYGMQRHRGGGMAVRTIACIPAVIGSWRHHGGGVLLTTSGTYDFAMGRLTRPDLSPPGTRLVNMNQLGEALAGELPGPAVRAVYVYNSNPAAVAPNQQKVIKGLKRDDLFVVVHELYATDTVDYADLVLPATSQLEQVDIHGSYGHHDVMYNAPAIAPRGECRSNNDVFRDLARRLGFEPELFPDDETLIRRSLERRRNSGGNHARAAARGRARPLEHPGRIHSVRGGGVSHAFRKVRALFRADEGRRVRPTAGVYSAARRPAHASRAGPATSAATAQPPAPAVPQLHLRQLTPPLHFSRRPRNRAFGPGRGGTRPEGWPVGRGLQRPGPIPRQGEHRAAAYSPAWPSPPESTGTSSRRGGTNVNGTTSSALTDMGGGATFFDNLVEVRAVITSRGTD